MDRRYADRLALLVAILPSLDTEPRFALKGGTAINLFEHDLPRLSVDIDLTWLPEQDFETDAVQIAEALTALGQRLTASPMQLQVRPSAAASAATITRLIASRGRAQVQIETTPVMRGAVHPIRRMDLRPSVERQFGSAQVQVLHFADLYGGKMAAALSRQHPRDLFDIGMLMDGGGLDAALFRTFLIYLTASPKPAAEMLAPGELKNFAEVYESQFRGMTREPVTMEWLLDVRRRLLAQLPQLVDDGAARFLVSVERESPDFSLIGLPHAGALPGVRRKLQNLALRSTAKREADYRKLAEVLERLKA